MNESAELQSRIEAISTRGDLLREASEGTETSAHIARNILVMRYRHAIRSYLGALLQDEYDADDVAQSVVVKLLKGNFASVDKVKGRFRDYLKTAVRNAALDHLRAKKRHATDDHGLIDAGVGAMTDDDRWLTEWRQTILRMTWDALEQHQSRYDGSLVFTVLRLATDHADDNSDELAQRLSEKVGRPIRADAARKQLSRARQRFAQFLIEEIRNSLDDPTTENIADELRELGLASFLDNFDLTESE